MIDGDLAKTIVGGIVGGGISISTIPLLFKGELLFKREIERQDKAHDKEIAALKTGYEGQVSEQSETIEKLEAANARLEQELREQYRSAIEQSREIMSAVKFLQSLGGLAAQDRRRTE